MNLSEIKNLLPKLENVLFELENGTFVPNHVHATEVGVTTKHFIDCGGTVRNEKVANFQLWVANDFEHRLTPAKLLYIINLSEEKLIMEDLEIEVEYQGKTIEKYGLDFNGKNFVLVAKQTNCLAQDKCDIPSEIQKPPATTCAPASGCC